MGTINLKSKYALLLGSLFAKWAPTNVSWGKFFLLHGRHFHYQPLKHSLQCCGQSTLQPLSVSQHICGRRLLEVDRASQFMFALWYIYFYLKAVLVSRPT